LDAVFGFPVFPGAALCAARAPGSSPAGKTYAVDVRSFQSAFSPSAVCIRAALNLGVSFSRVVTQWLEDAAAAEEEARANPSGEPQRPLPPFEWEQPLWNGAGLFCRETVVVLTRRALEKLVARACVAERGAFGLTPRYAAKLLKDVPRSARRKCERVAWEKGKSKMRKAFSMARTTARATVTRVLAEFLIASAISTVACRKLYQLRKTGALPPPSKTEARREEDARAAKDDEGSRLENRAVSIEREVGSLYARLLFGHVVKGACLILGGAFGAASAAYLRKEDAPKWASRLTFLGVAAGEACGGIVATNLLSAAFGTGAKK
jgi:hypothetical protein